MRPERERRRPDVATVEIVGGIEKRALVLADSDPRWPEAYDAHERRIRTALGRAAVQIEHIGSTSVPALAAKPIIDVLVTVEDITAEEDYLDQLLGAGYALRVREPGHRLVRTPARDVHVHVLEVGDPAAEDYLLFRDRLRAHSEERELYERTKRLLIEQDWPDMNAYADAKTGIITEIKERARRSAASVQVIEIGTDRLLLRGWRPCDLAPWAAINADPEVREHLGGPLTRAESDASVARFQAGFAERGYGWWALEERATGQLIGFAGLDPVDEWMPFSGVEIGWRLTRAAWGKGYATEAARAVLGFGFGTLGLSEVVALTTTGNRRSQAVMRRIGMTHDPADDVDDPTVPEGPLKRTVVYRIARPRN